MHILWCKLKRLKEDIKKFSKQYGNLKQRISEVRGKLHEAQKNLLHNRQDSKTIEDIRMLTEEVIKLHDHEEDRLKQRVKVNWIKSGDENTEFFFAYLKARHNRNCITFLQRDNGEVITNKKEIEQEVRDFYSSLMGDNMKSVKHIDIEAMQRGNQLQMSQKEYLQSRVTYKEVEDALNDIGDYKSPGIDGFSAKLFKNCWQTLKCDVYAAVDEFFKTGMILKGFNQTVVTLIPKGEHAKNIRDFRPIAGCTVFLKIISKVLTNRMRSIMPDVISKNQAAFVVGQDIHNHIHLAYELLKGYERKNGTPRCMFQIDLQKAYDMVHWDALDRIMKEMGFPNTFVKWVMNLVQTVTYIFKVNGCFTDSLQAKRGIRQGDPISPLLFVIMVKYLNRCLVKMQDNSNFNHHAKCERLALTNLAFADDILLFCRGDTGSVNILLNVFKDFSASTGLIFNPRKCKAFFGCVDEDSKNIIKASTGFEEGRFPVKYLGVPLSSKKINIQHYLPLIEKITSRVRHWSAKLLSYAGRVQLVKSIVCSITQYWMMNFPIPKAVLKKIDVVCRTFIWTGKIAASRKVL